jgi:hypothetical protein
MSEIQSAKLIVREYQQAFDVAPSEGLVDTLMRYTADAYHWRGMHPFYEHHTASAVCESFWLPFRAAFVASQRREDIFLCGRNDVDGGESVWVCSMGHFMGLFDHPWLGIPPTGRIAFLPYAEFHRVVDGKIAETALFCDIIKVMQQAGHYPLPPQAGAAFIHPGPRTHDGVKLGACEPEAALETMALVNRMVADLDHLNKTGIDECSPEYLARSWREDMAWFGPAGIGSTYTIARYQAQHQLPFRKGLTDKVYHGHVARFAEDNFAAFFGWANLSNRSRGGWLGMPEAAKPSEMRVVDVYRREGDRLAENWVFIDLLHYFSLQGLDLLGRMRELNGPA